MAPGWIDRDRLGHILSLGRALQPLRLDQRDIGEYRPRAWRRWRSSADWRRRSLSVSRQRIEFSEKPQIGSGRLLQNFARHFDDPVENLARLP